MFFLTSSLQQFFVRAACFKFIHPTNVLDILDLVLGTALSIQLKAELGLLRPNFAKLLHHQGPYMHLSDIVTKLLVNYDS